MSGAPLPLLLLVVSGRAAFTSCRSLNAPRDPSDELFAPGTGGDRWHRPLVEKVRPFILLDGQHWSLVEGLQRGHPDRLQVGLRTAGRVYLLDLEKNRELLLKPPEVFYYLSNGTGVSVSAAPVTHCYYHGNVRGFPRSRAALSACTGLRGVFVVNSTLSFEIEPQAHNHHQGEQESQAAEGGDDGVHLLYTTRPLEGAGGCGVSHTPVPLIHRSTYARRRQRDVLSETKYIELVLVVDHQEFLNYQKNNRTIFYRMLDLANQVDWFYRPLNVRVALTGLEIWTDRDKIQVEKNPTKTLNNFLEWRTRDLLPRLHHDNAQLIMGGSFDGTTVGMASQLSMCSRERSGGVSVDHLVSVLGVASTVAHELGHNLGMNHDTAERHCFCQNEPRLGGCIMEPSTGFLPGQQFSSCSASDLSSSLLHGAAMCLFNVPQPDRLLGGARCGNQRVEPGEECDCGLLQECEDACCNASTCRLLPGAQCSSDGTCCRDCKLRSAGSACRDSLGECDLPEFCTGSSPHCPPNVFLQDGEHCADGASYCFGGACSSADTQCQRLWGTNASSAPAVCFASVNTQGNKFGNCGQLADGSYVACRTADVHCGKLQCQGGRERPLLGNKAETHTKVPLNQSDVVCRGTFFHLGDDVSDLGTVAQGTPCGPSKVCLNQRCQEESVFGVEECRNKCSGHGVCNSNQNCHCDPGWAPPDCRYSGHGGSMDSGPATPTGDSGSIRVAVLVVFFLIVPVVLFLVFRRFRQRLWCFGTSSHSSKAAPHSRTPAGERADSRNGEQVRPLRFRQNLQAGVPLAPPQKEVNDRPAPPTKALPPDPALTTVTQVSIPLKPVPPKKPRPVDLWPRPQQPRYSTSTKPPQCGAVAPAAGPHRRPPVPPCPRDEDWAPL